MVQMEFSIFAETIIGVPSLELAFVTSYFQK